MRSAVMIVAASAAALGTACGASHEDESDADVADGPSPGRDAGSLVADCPTAAPSTGATCSRRRLACEYGDDWNPSCNTIAQCWSGGALDGTWQVSMPDSPDCPTPTSLVAGCPAAAPSVGAACGESDTVGVCVYEATRCVCFPFTGAGPDPTTTYMWQCDSAPDPGCPAGRPRIGSACTTAGLTCTYAVCSYGGGTYCSDGAWTQAITPNICVGGM